MHRHDGQAILIRGAAQSDIRYRRSPAVAGNGTSASRRGSDGRERKATSVPLLHGPSDQVERQGRLLTSRLNAIPNTRVLAPWAGGNGLPGLRPSPDKAGILVSTLHRPGEKFIAVVPRVEKPIRETIRPPVDAN